MVELNPVSSHESVILRFCYYSTCNRFDINQSHTHKTLCSPHSVAAHSGHHFQTKMIYQ